MENFVLYHEIYKKDGMIMYKGRKKGTISYVAVSCIDKEQRIKVTNHVRLVFELNHSHIVRFYEWYETSNHLWLVTDLCVGGSLQQMITEDVCFPEVSIRVFGTHLVRGLQYLHSRGIICVRWHPGKIVLDGSGVLKFFDLSDARKFGETGEDLVQRYFSGLSVDPREIEELFDPGKSVSSYSAPEIIQGDAPGFAADVWGLGCLLYEMFTGQAPFGGVSDDEIIESVLHSPLIIPTKIHQGTRVAARASMELTDLLQHMLQKNPDSRISLSALCQHPFWQGELSDLYSQSINSSAQTAPTTAFVDSHRPKTASHPTVSDDDQSLATNTVIDDISFTLHLGSRGGASVEGTAAPASETRLKRGQFQLEPPSEVTEQPNLPVDQQKLLQIARSSSVIDLQLSKSPIDDYSRMLKDGRLKYDVKSLAITPISAVKLKTLRKSEREKHLKQLDSLIKTVEKGPPTQKRLNLINYVSHVCLTGGGEIAQYMIESGIVSELTKQLRGSSNQDLTVRLCQSLAIILHSCHGDGIVSYRSLDETITCLGDVLRDQFRCSKIKIAALAALGECLVKQSESSSESSDIVNNSQMILTLINRCLHRSEEVSTNLIASRIFETIASHPNSTLAKQISNSDTIQQLYNCYKHATLDQLKVSSAIAMCRLTRLDSLLFCSLLDKIGTSGLLDNIHLALLGVQESVLEMFSVVMLLQANVASIKKLPQETSFLKSVMRLLETPAPIVRAKSLLLVLLLCRSDLSLLRVASENRLVLYLERELKRVENTESMGQCLDVFTEYLSCCAVPAILTDCCSALQSVHGRRHPSSLQTKALRTSLPLLECITNFTSSPSLRSRIFSDSFYTLLGQLVTHANRVDAGHTSLGPDTAPQFVTHVLALVEAACHANEPTHLLLLEHILPPLSAFTGTTSNPDIRIIGLKLCADIISLVVQSDILESHLIDLKSLTNAVESQLLPQMQQFIIDPDPSAVYLIRLIRNYLQINTDQCISTLKQLAFPKLLVQLIYDHQQRIMTAVVLESLLLICALVEISPDFLRDFILDADLVPVLCDTLLEIGDVYHKDDISLRTPKSSELLQAGMESLFSIAKLISDVVRRALQSKKTQENDESTIRLTREAEELLGAGKPLAEMVDLLIYSLSNSEFDVEVVESSIKLLNQIVSLYGGQQIHHGLNEINLQYLCSAILSSSVKQKRTLLRVIKRLLISGPLPHQSVLVVVRDMVSNVMTKSNVECDSVCLGLAEEIQKCLNK